MTNSKISLLGLPKIPKISPGDDIAETIVDSLRKENLGLENGDVLVIAQSIVSKSIGAIVNLENVHAGEEALNIYKKMEPLILKEGIPKKTPQLIQLILDESKKVIKAEHVLIVETKFGFICANAGIDKSNVDGENNVTLLPKDPDAEAEKIRYKLKNLTGKDVAIIISDSFGRPFRRGSVGIAVGISGISALLDMRGKKDLYGKILQSTIVGQVDNLTSAAQLIMGEANEGFPIILIRGYNFKFEENTTIKEIIRSKETDVFRQVEEKELLPRILKSRRSYKLPFSSKIPEINDVRECISLARWAPSAHNAQHWRYIILSKGETREKLIFEMNAKFREDLTRDGRSDNFIEQKMKKTRTQFLEAPYLILLCLDESKLELYSDKKRTKNEYFLGVQSIGASAAYFLLALEVNSLAACWYSAPLFAKEIIRECLNLPDSFSPMAFFTVGYASERVKAPTRKNLKEVIYKIGD
ncbi:MAG: coenzyme F420-0:L-glutamate ligase [Promethearchaeota archaeon]|nr:MAG: coenzyme F420-0:L-glutamate ligase [Candidatus Lokiarchaeota archaeon]